VHVDVCVVLDSQIKTEIDVASSGIAVPLPMGHSPDDVGASLHCGSHCIAGSRLTLDSFLWEGDGLDVAYVGMLQARM